MDSPITLDINELPHVKLINEENVDIKKLPARLRNEIRLIVLNVKNFTKKPSNALSIRIKKMSVKIADAIQDHLEADIQDTPEPKNPDMKDDKTPTEPVNEPAATEPVAATPAEPATPEPVVEPVAAVPAAEPAQPAAPKKEVIKGDSGKANKIYSELDELLKQNKISLSLDELKKLAPTSYSVIFDSYKEGEENGIEIGDIQLRETEKEKFTITK